MIFDTHAHYYDEAFDADRNMLLPRLHEENGVTGIVNAAENVETSLRCAELAEQYDFCWGAAGVHPNYAEDFRDEDVETLRALLRLPKMVAVGEIGLDYHYRRDNRERQEEVFARQMELAKEENKPVILHNREAHGDMYRLLRQYRPEGVMHCFSGGVELARDALAIGLYIGMGGSVTFENARKLRDAARFVPLDRLVLETDAPYLTPLPCRASPKERGRCDSSMIRATASVIASLRGMDTEELLEITVDNARRLYRLPAHWQEKNTLSL